MSTPRHFTLRNVGLALASCTVICAAEGVVVAQSASKPTPAAIERATEREKLAAQSQPATGARSSVLPPAPQGGGSDDCATPEVLVGTGNVSFDTTTATTGTQGQAEPQCNVTLGAGTGIHHDVWFTWNAPSTGLARITTCGLTTVDTKIAVYAGTACPVTGSAIECNDDACSSRQSTLEFPCTGGADYVIQLGNYPGVFPPAVGGPGTFDLAVFSVAPNDDCNTPQTVVGVGPTAFDNSSATTGPQGQSEALCMTFGSSLIVRDLWYDWVAPFTGTASVRTCGSALDTRIAVYSGSGCPTGSAIACNDDACGLQSRAVFACTSGQTYTFQIGLFQGAGAGGTGTFEVLSITPPTNDDCAAQTIIGGPGPFAFDLDNATTGSEGQAEAQCSQLGTTAIHADVWYLWTAPSTGVFAVQDVGLTSVDTKIAVYDGAGCPLAPSIACNDDANEPNFVYLQSRALFQAIGGNTYTIQLGLSGTTFEGGAGEFTVRRVVAPANDDCVTSATLFGAGPHLFDNSQATTGFSGQGQAACSAFGSTSVADDVWYTWFAHGSGVATLSFCGSTTVDTKVAVYDGGGCPITTALACNDDACGSPAYQSQLDFPVVCGQIYTIQVGVYPLWNAPAGGEGRFTITITGGGGCATGTVFCAGDGVAPHTPCPCGNDSAPLDGVGCINSLGQGGMLRAVGNASVSGDSFVLQGAQMPNNFCLYIQGTTQVNGGNGALFGDGLRCAGGSISRLGTQINVGGASHHPGPGQPGISVLGAIPPAGGMRTYQCWYRNAAAFCTSDTFNLTNGLEVLWVP